MQFDDAFFWYAGGLMQSVYILCNDGRTFSDADEFLNCTMSAVWFGFYNCFVSFDFSPPRFSAHLFRIHKILKIDGFEFVPDATGTSKVWDSGLRADPRTSKNNDTSGVLDKVSQLVC